MCQLQRPRNHTIITLCYMCILTTREKSLHFASNTEADKADTLLTETGILQW